MKAVVERPRFSPFLEVVKTYQVYLIENPSGRHYIGLSEDVGKRLADHNAGVSKWTAKHGPWHLVWTSKVMNLSDARHLENALKRQKGGDGLARLLEAYKGS